MRYFVITVIVIGVLAIVQWCLRTEYPQANIKLATGPSNSLLLCEVDEKPKLAIFSPQHLINQFVEEGISSDKTVPFNVTGKIACPDYTVKYQYDGKNTESILLNGKSYNLKNGALFVLSSDGKITQAAFLPLDSMAEYHDQLEKEYCSPKSEKTIGK